MGTQGFSNLSVDVAVPGKGPVSRVSESQPSVPRFVFSDEEEELNEDTVEKIVRCIIQNEGKRFLGLAGDMLTALADTCPFSSLFSKCRGPQGDAGGQ